MPAKNPLLAAALDRLIDGSRLDEPDRFCATVRDAALRLGATEAVVYVQDYGQQVLLEVDGATRLPIHDSDPGQAFMRLTTVVGGEETGDGVRMWVPLQDGATRVGVLELAFDRVDPEVRRIAERFASVAAEMLVSRDAVTDRFDRLRRLREMGLAAEMQWELLPPLSFSTTELSVSGILEPAYSVGGDAFDYSYDRVLHLALVDAMGHGVQAALTSSLAVNAYRHARRRGLGLEELWAAMDEEVARHRPDHFATAVVAQLDPATGVLRWVNGGHPAPRVLRDGVLVDIDQRPSTVPCGWGEATGGPGEVVVRDHQLEPGDIVCLVTDGVVEQPNAEGTPFGEERLIGLLVRHSGDELHLEESLRRIISELMAFASRGLRDDATLLLVRYEGSQRATG